MRTVLLASGLVVAVLGALIARGGSSHAANPDVGRVAVFDLGTGALRFVAEAPTASVHVHAIGSGVVVLTGADSCHTSPYGHEAMYALSLERASFAWQRALPGACFDYATPTPTTRGVVPVQVRRGIQGWRTSDGSIRWSDRMLQDPLGSPSTIMTVNSNSGDVMFVDERSGRVRVAALAPFHPTGWLLTGGVAPLVTQSDTKMPDWKQRLTALDIRSGRRLWQRTLGRFYGFSPPAGSGSVVMLTWADPISSRTDAFDVRTGRRLWQRRSSPPFGDAIVAAGSGVALSFSGGMLEADDLRTGDVRWRVPMEKGQVIVGEGSVGVLGSDVRMLDAGTGAVRWTQPLPSAGVPWGGSAGIGAGVLVVTATSPAYEPSDG